MTTNLRVSFNKRFNTDLESDFDSNINGDEDIDDENIQFSSSIFSTIYIVLF